MAGTTKRIRQTGGFDLPLPLAEAFKLFTAEGERLWVPGWSPRILGIVPQAPGLVFLTGEGAEATIWTVLESDAASGRIRYSRVTPGSRAGIVAVTLSTTGDGTRVEVSYDLTALSAQGEAALEDYAPAPFGEMMDEWRRLIMDFLASEDGLERLRATDA